MHIYFILASPSQLLLQNGLRLVWELQRCLRDFMAFHSVLWLQLAPIFSLIVTAPSENDKELYLYKLAYKICFESQRLVFSFRNMVLQLQRLHHWLAMSARSVMCLAKRLTRVRFSGVVLSSVLLTFCLSFHCTKMLFLKLFLSVSISFVFEKLLEVCFFYHHFCLCCTLCWIGDTLNLLIMVWNVCEVYIVPKSTYRYCIVELSRPFSCCFLCF